MRALIAERCDTAGLSGSGAAQSGRGLDEDWLGDHTHADGGVGDGPIYHALGRGHLALRDYDQARRMLEAALARIAEQDARVAGQVTANRSAAPALS